MSASLIEILPPVNAISPSQAMEVDALGGGCGLRRAVVTSRYEWTFLPAFSWTATR